MWWGEKKTYVEVTRPWYVQALPFLLKSYVPTCRQRAAENRARYCKGHPLMTDSELENKVGQMQLYIDLGVAAGILEIAAAGLAVSSREHCVFKPVFFRP